MSLSRRDFLKLGALTGAGLVAGELYYSEPDIDPPLIPFEGEETLDYILQVEETRVENFIDSIEDGDLNDRDIPIEIMFLRNYCIQNAREVQNPINIVQNEKAARGVRALERIIDLSNNDKVTMEAVLALMPLSLLNGTYDQWEEKYKNIVPPNLRAILIPGIDSNYNDAFYAGESFSHTEEALADALRFYTGIPYPRDSLSSAMAEVNGKKEFIEQMAKKYDVYPPFLAAIIAAELFDTKEFCVDTSKACGSQMSPTYAESSGLLPLSQSEDFVDSEVDPEAPAGNTVVSSARYSQELIEKLKKMGNAGRVGLWFLGLLAGSDGAVSEKLVDIVAPFVPGGHASSVGIAQTNLKTAKERGLAQSFISGRQLKPDAPTWRTLLGLLKDNNSIEAAAKYCKVMINRMKSIEDDGYNIRFPSFNKDYPGYNYRGCDAPYFDRTFPFAFFGAMYTSPLYPDAPVSGIGKGMYLTYGPLYTNQGWGRLVSTLTEKFETQWQN